MKILELQLKLLKVRRNTESCLYQSAAWKPQAENEMIKDALHTNISRVLSQFGPASKTVHQSFANPLLQCPLWVPFS